MITNLEKNFEAIRCRKFVEDFKSKNTKKEKAIYFNPKQKLWVLSENENSKTKKFIKEFEETLPKKVKKKTYELQEIKNKILSLYNKGFSVKEIHEETGIEKRKVYGIIWYVENKEKY